MSLMERDLDKFKRTRTQSKEEAAESYYLNKLKTLHVERERELNLVEATDTSLNFTYKHGISPTPGLFKLQNPIKN